MAHDRHTCALCTLEWDSDTDALLCRIGDLLKQLVDNSNQAALLISELQKTTQREPVGTDKSALAPNLPPANYVCPVCGFRCYSESTYETHTEHHSEMYRLAQDIAKR